MNVATAKEIVSRVINRTPCKTDTENRGFSST